MLITPRTYIASQTPDHASSRAEGASRFYTLAGWHQSPVDTGQAADMLFIHQVGSVRVGEVARTPKEPPQFEPYLKAGGSWDAVIKMPTRFGDSHNLAVGQLGPDGDRSMTWVIEIVSQVIFSNSAAVHFELLVGRDAKSVDFFFVWRRLDKTWTPW
ncbi:hypothetical protein N7526_010151 [Penicillium atrosanguineum]|nr:hypothetical protein N7526_010151 [Penicillium atrosanguineum]